MASGFQAFVQSLDENGSLVGNAVDGYVEDGRFDSYPSIAANSKGDIYLSYVRGGNGQDNDVVQAMIPAGDATPQPQPPRVVATVAGDTSSFYAVDPANDRLYLAYASNDDIILTDGTDMNGSAASITLGATSGRDYAPRVVAAANGGAVFWYRNISGFHNQFTAQGFTFDGSQFTLGTLRAVTDSLVPPYAPAAAHVVGDVYVVAWSEGDSPNFRMKMAFVSVP